MSDVTKTPREELECKKKYLYEHSMFWECNDGSKCQILEDDVCDLLNEQQATIIKLQDKLFAMQHTIANQENAIFHLKDTDDNLRKKNIRIEELSKVVHNLKMVLSNDDEQVAKIVGEQQATIEQLKSVLRKECNIITDEDLLEYVKINGVSLNE